MSASAPESGNFWLSIILRRPYTLSATLFLALFVIPFCTRKQSDWEYVYIPAAQRLFEGKDVFEGGFVYPPINAWLMLPFVGMPRIPARLLWFALNGTALFILICGAWKVSGGGPLEGSPPASRREHMIFGLGLLCGIYYAFDALTNQQTDLLVAALVIAGCQALGRRSDWKTGLLIGVAAGVKCTPLLWAGYLAWRKRWASALLVPVVAVGINLLPDLTHPPATSMPRIEDWGRRFLAPMAESDHDLGTWASAILHNHSLAGVSNRWLTWESTRRQGKTEVAARADRVGPNTLKVVGLGSMLLFFTAAWFCSWKGGRRPGFALFNSEETAPSPAALEYSLVLILMLLLCPQSSKPHFCTLLLPGFCLTRAALTWPSRPLKVLVLLIVACGLVSNKDLVGGRVYDWALWHGSVTLSAVLLHAGCCVALILPTRRATALPGVASNETAGTSFNRPILKAS